MSHVIVRFANVGFRGAVGEFRGDGETFSWHRAAGDGDAEATSFPVSLVRRAEWFEGRVRVLCEREAGSGCEVLAFDNFQPEDFDPLWRYLETFSSTYLKKHLARSSCSETEFDDALRLFEHAADRVDESARGSVQKKAREADLMQTVEAVRTALEHAIAGDRQELSRIFGADSCERIGKLRLLLDTVRLDIFCEDPRWLHLRNLCDTIEAVLSDMGTYRTWRPWEEALQAAWARRRKLASVPGQVAGALAGPSVAGLLQRLQGAQPSLPQAPMSPAQYPRLGLRGPPPLWGEEDLRQKRPTMRKPCAPQQLALPDDVGHPEPASGDAAAGGAASACGGSSGSTTTTPFGAAESHCQHGALAQRCLAKWECDPRSREPPTPPAASRNVFADSVFEGWVWKRSRYLGLWRRRYLVLRRDLVLTFEDRACEEATEAFAAAAVRAVEAVRGDGLQTEMRLRAGRRTYNFMCDAKCERDEWMRRISQVAADAAKRRQGSERPRGA